MVMSSTEITMCPWVCILYHVLKLTQQNEKQILSRERTIKDEKLPFDSCRKGKNLVTFGQD